MASASGQLGYGPTAVTSVPLLQGTSNWNEFNTKLVAFAFAQQDGSFEILQNPAAVIEKLVGYRPREAKEADPLKQLQAVNGKLAASIIMRLADKVSAQVRQVFGPDLAVMFDGARLYLWLKRVYEPSVARTQREYHPVTSIAKLLGARMEKRENALAFLLGMRPQLLGLLSQPLLAASATARIFAEAQVANHVLEEIPRVVGGRYRVALEPFAARCMPSPLSDKDRTTAPEAGALFEAIIAAVEAVDLASGRGADDGTARISHRGATRGAPRDGKSARPEQPRGGGGGKKQDGKPGGKPRHGKKDPASVSTVSSTSQESFSPDVADVSVNESLYDSSAVQGGTASSSQTAPLKGGPRQSPSSPMATASNHQPSDSTPFVSAAAAAGQSLTQAKNALLLDSGATHHCIRSRALFESFRPTKVVVRLANSRTIIATGIGTVRLHLPPNGMQSLLLEEVLFTPAFGNNILSTNRLRAAATGSSGTPLPPATWVLEGPNPHVQVGTLKLPVHYSTGDSGRLPWFIPCPAPVPRAAVPLVQVADATLAAQSAPVEASTTRAEDQAVEQRRRRVMTLHYRLGHTGFETILELAKADGSTKGLSAATLASSCRDCLLAKIRKTAISAQAARDPNILPGRRIHCDIKTDLPKAYNGYSNAAIFVDESSRMVVAIPIVSKDHLADACRDAFSEYRRNHVPVGQGSALHTDAEKVNLGKAMTTMLSEWQMSATASPPYTHERNGIVERAIQSVFDVVRVLLQSGDMPQEYWPVALAHAVFLRNRLPTEALGGISPIQQLTAQVPRLSTLKTFGAAAVVRRQDKERATLDPRGREGIYVGHDPITDAPRIMLFNTKKMSIVSSVHCVVDESRRPFKELEARRPQGVDEHGNEMFVAERILDSRTVKVGRKSFKEYFVRWTGYSPESDSWEPASSFKGDQFMIKEFERQQASASPSVSQTVSGDTKVPLSFSQAMKSSEAALWSRAIGEELASLRENATFDLVEVVDRTRHKVLSTKWVFTLKPDDLQGVRYKARLVARGDQQRDINLDELYSPVANYRSVRSMLAVAAIKDYDLDHVDVKTAFLNAELPPDQEIYVSVPDGYELPATIDRKRAALRLSKSLYGLRQAPNLWNETLHKYLLSKGFTQSQIDPCLYLQNGKLWILVWVDDLLLMSADKQAKQAFKADLAARFKIHDLGDVKSFLGLEVVRDRAAHSLTIRAPEKISAMLHSFAMVDARSAETPLPPNIQLLPTPDNVQPLDRRRYPYRALVGSLLYLAQVFRPDISFAVSELARHQERPSLSHWEAGKHVLRYLKGTRLMGITYSASDCNAGDRNEFFDVFRANVPHRATDLHAFADASWGDDVATRHSHTGWVFRFANAALSWRSVLQRTVSLSSTEAEYYSLSDCLKEASALRNVVAEFLPDGVSSALVVHEDNQSAIKLALNQGVGSSRTKHIDIRHHFIKEAVASGDIRLSYIPTAVQIADVLTKNVDRLKVSSCRRVLLNNHA
jgi:hypothetical protein